MTLPNSQIRETFLNLIEDPTKRFQKFFDHYVDTINVNVGTQVNSYFRSGKEMLRMGNIYFTEHDYFHSFVLYSRFIVLFYEKIKQHPNYSSCDKTQLNAMLKEIKLLFPRVEKLKKYIKDIFETQANDHKRNKEEEEKNKLTATAPPALPEPLSTTQLDEIKRKYNLENENEFKLLQDSMSEQQQQQQQQEHQTTIISDNKPTIDRNLKPRIENSYNFRTIIIPKDLTSKFLDLAFANTSRNIETCGILAGKLNQNTFTLSHCIIPKQSGSSDTCTTEQEHELFDTIDQLNLITLGWIHTHPSQTAFLSSIDLHTHYGYQIMIPEAIAIVCAPSFNTTKTFILSPDFGLKEIGECQKGGFHPHTITPSLFEECDHVREDSNLKANLIDLRIITNRYF